MKNINWNKIQKFYDANHTWKDIINEFGISNETVNKAVKSGKLKLRDKKTAGILANKKYPRKKLTDEIKKKISDSRIKYLKEHPEKVPYLLNHYSKGSSYPETYFNNIFNGRFEYKRYYQVSYYQIDFAILNKKIAIEIDGDQHYLDKKIIKSDSRKNKYLTNNGWDILRIKWSDYQKLKKEEKIEYVNDLINYINDIIKSKPNIHIIEKYNYCSCGKIINKRSKMCVKCKALKQKRKIENRPTLKILLEDIKNGYEATGRKYGVTGNCIKKWIKGYKINLF